ncbi:BlaI/MecI/CopY family transcriptional regulator [uncultured Paludibaculum sp.]|uniref:BlaI/MecI/CopY family transcriptional regulator n=1 Tax=uncultured Paludibaculum sp. TaxID=1765020 RepID=UPI002AAA952E|nr:BlaI/MecI/CopY family transcriptional regulator [uncultured Paludibaculum sp.]
MPRPSSSRPTDSELEILGVLWDKGAATVREVHEELSLRKPTGYTTVLKFMQIMTDKGLLTRREQHRVHVYESAVPREATQSELVRDLAQRAFGGSALELAMRALESNRATPGELDQIRRLLDQAEKGRR